MLCVGALSVGLTGGLFASHRAVRYPSARGCAARSAQQGDVPAKAVAFAVTSRLLFAITDQLTASGPVLRAARAGRSARRRWPSSDIPCAEDRPPASSRTLEPACADSLC